MGVKYSFSRYVIAGSVTAAMLVLPVACNDDFGYHNIEGQPIGFKLTAPAAWHDGMSVNDNAPDTRCTSVQALSGGDTKLYLHTVVADNPSEEKMAGTRGTPVTDIIAFTTAYQRFSLSGICYIGEYPTDEGNNPWTTEYAYNLYYSTSSGTPVDGGRQLLWPSKGKVRFFAFAPTVEDFQKKVGTDGSLKLSEASVPGSPTLTYTVPKDVKKQVDLMTVCHDARGATTSDVNVELKFGHALTAVQIKCGDDMLAGKITKVTIDGVHGTGTQVIGSNTWTTSETTKYTISDEIPLSPGAGEGVTDKIHAPSGTPIAGTETDNRTFMLLPQTVPPGATLTIDFTDDATGMQRTLTGSIAGHVWQAGKIVTYSISPSSIHINAVVNFDNKKDGDVIPYSGVWYDATYKARVEIVQAGVETKEIDDISADKVKIKYSFTNGDGEGSCTTDATGLLTIPAQYAYENVMKKGFTSGEKGSESSPFSLSDEYSETANCYLVDQAGYYSLALVYGNGDVSLPENNTDGFKYFPKHDDKNSIPNDGKITGVGDAVLVWQDSPDLIDPASVEIKGNNLVFRIREKTLAQGNAVVAVRSNDATDKKILWSWHIWVTPYKSTFYDTTKFYNSETECGDSEKQKYKLAKYNLGWCDRHATTDEKRTFTLNAEIDMSAYGGSSKTPVPLGTFTQMEFKGSAAGDNTYYQWGRKDPMLGGIYNIGTLVYSYKKRGNGTVDSNEFTMENKQVFNEYTKDGYDYSFRKNKGDGVDLTDYASNGVTIGYTIMHPYMFITNSRCDDGGDTPKPAFNYRNHWHKPYKECPVNYLNEGTHIMFNAWNAGAVSPGYAYGDVFNDNDTFKAGFSKEEYLKRNATVKKSVYDPCPPKFKVPPIDAFRGIAKARASNDGNHVVGTATFSDTNREWTVTNNGGSITFPATGVRNYALRNNEWGIVTGLPPSITKEDFYKTSMPAFRMLSFVSSATIVKKEDYNAYQLLILAIDFKDRQKPSTSNIKMSCYTTSSNSYGLPVRPMHDD